MADVQIIHPGLGPEQIATVSEESLPHHYRAGWRLLAEGETPPTADEETPAPMSKAEAAKTASKKGSPS